MIEEWASVSSLWAALGRAARGKRRRASVARALLERERVVLDLHRALLSGTWRPSAPSHHVIHDPKTRLITAAPFVDRVVHQACCAALGPALDGHLVSTSFACRVGRGTHAAVALVRRWAAAHAWVLHLDVRRFFPSIDHGILRSQLERHVRCARTLAVCERILEAGAGQREAPGFWFPGDDLFTPHGRRVGLPIGNLTSQHFANRYLSPVDHLAKDRLRVRRYLRYMDDMLLFGDDPAHLRAWGLALEARCHRLRLRLHPWLVRATRDGVGFLGFRVLPGGVVRVKRATVARARRRLADLARDAAATGDPSALLRSLRSTFAHWEHADSWRLRDKTLRELGWHWQGDEDST
ncbi:MAG: RNA-directed DNA polymerase [Polyangiaceae bacterium]|nr:RNA-directed DNA polymerase [Polyangiaceae bacterium]